jgi:hypothetical protein
VFRYIISFVMPSKYTLDTLPKARNPNVEFREVPPQLLASYSIRWVPYYWFLTCACCCCFGRLGMLLNAALMEMGNLGAF